MWSTFLNLCHRSLLKDIQQRHVCFFFISRRLTPSLNDTFLNQLVAQKANPLGMPTKNPLHRNSTMTSRPSTPHIAPFHMMKKTVADIHSLGTCETCDYAYRRNKHGSSVGRCLMNFATLFDGKARQHTYVSFVEKCLGHLTPGRGEQAPRQ